MKNSLQPGISKVRRLVVDSESTISFMGEEGRVYGTPWFCRDIEQTCREILLDHADAGEDSVGMEVVLRHAAPTLLGMEVEITATVNAVEGRKVTFDVSAKDELESIGGGTHTRFVLDIGKSHVRLKAKAAKRAAARVG